MVGGNVGNADDVELGWVNIQLFQQVDISQSIGILIILRLGQKQLAAFLCWEAVVEKGDLAS